MRGMPAKIVSIGDLRRLLRAVRDTRQPERNRVIVLLSFKAGLRACEIAGLEWNMVIDAKGRVGRFIELPAAIAKNGSGRRIPMNDELRRGLIQLRKVELTNGAVVQSERGGAMRPAAIVNWFAGVYEELGLIGCSSHSGRRTFVTNAARLVMKAGGSLRDVQLLAGHWSIKTTEGYIEGSERAQRRLVKMIYRGLDQNNFYKFRMRMNDLK